MPSRIHAFGNPSKLSLTNHRTAPLLIRIKHFLCALRSISEKIHLKILKISDNFSPKRTFDRTPEFCLRGYGKIYQVGSLLWSNQMSCLGDGFYTPLARISKDKYSGHFHPSMVPSIGFEPYKILAQRTVARLSILMESLQSKELCQSLQLKWALLFMLTKRNFIRAVFKT